jgi:hypothetical protein
VRFLHEKLCLAYRLHLSIRPPPMYL